LAFAVGDSDDPDVVVQKEIDDDVGEVLNQIAACGVVSQWPSLREVTNRLDGGFYFSGKIKPKSGTFAFVVRHGFPEFGLSFAENGD
jgi:hypothetical protein